MEEGYERVRNVIKKALRDTFSLQIDDFVHKTEKVIKKVVKQGESMDLDLSKILGLIQGLHFIKGKKDKKAKKLALTLILASIIALSLGYTIKNYASIKKGKTPEEKIKIFIENLHLEKIRDNPTIKKVRREIKSLMEQEL